MPTTKPADVPHTTITDHRIRKPGGAPPAPPAATPTELKPMAGLEVDPLEAQRNLGIAHSNRGGETGDEFHHRRAVELLDATRQAFRNDARHRFFHGLSLASLGKFRRAVDALQEALAIDDRIEPAHNALTTCAYWSGQKELARKHVGRSLQINPYRIDMLLMAAQLEIDAGRPAEARPYYERILRLQSGHPEALRGLSLTQPLRR